MKRFFLLLSMVFVCTFVQAQSTIYTEQTVVICENELPYSLNDRMLTKAGDYVFTFKTSLGLDSVVTVHLRVTPDHYELKADICTASLPYHFLNALLTESGDYDFTTQKFVCGEKIYDVEGNEYNTVQIGEQCWMAENLRTKTMPDGTKMQQWKPGLTITELQENRYCYEIRNENIGTSVFYPWMTACDKNTNTNVNIEVQGVCPNGWHVPSYKEFAEMFVYLDPTFDPGTPYNRVRTGNDPVAEQSSRQLAVKLGDPNSHWLWHTGPGLGEPTTSSTTPQTLGYNYINNVKTPTANISGFNATANGYLYRDAYAGGEEFWWYQNGTLNLWCSHGFNVVKISHDLTGIGHYYWGRVYADAYNVRCIKNADSESPIGASSSCEKTVKLHLIVHEPSLNNDVYDTICKQDLPYQFGDTVLTQGGSYHFSLQTAYGCDSTVTLHLVVLSKCYDISEETCENVPYSFIDTTFSEKGDYMLKYHFDDNHNYELVNKDGKYEFVRNDFACGDKMKDIENNEYSTVLIGKQCWMQENLKVKTTPQGTPLGSASYAEITHDVMGTQVYYPWAAAVNNEGLDDVVQGLCPDGWHVPSYAEFVKLYQYVDSQWDAATADVSNNQLAIKLASKTGNWKSYGGEGIDETAVLFDCASTPGSPGYAFKNNPDNSLWKWNESKFNAIPCGLIESYWRFNGSLSLWATNASTAISCYKTGIMLSDGHGTEKRSVRCIYGGNTTAQIPDPEGGQTILVRLQLSVNPTYHVDIFDTICQSELPYHFLDSTIADAGEYDMTFSSVDGCDSVVTLHLEVNPTYHHKDAMTICQSSLPYTYGNHTFDENTVSGDYDVLFYTEKGCDSLVTLHLTVNDSENTEFCMVTVNEKNMNQLVWEKKSHIDHYNLYRESDVSGQYGLIASVPFDESAIWTDSSSNANVRSYRYRISSVDECKVESALSTIHKTMHLSISAGINKSWNLTWNEYEGASFSTYHIYRGNTSGNLEHIATLPANSTSYTDEEVSSDVVYYQVAIVLDEPCNPMKAYSTIKSNMATNDVSGINICNFEHAIAVYPNPTSGKFVVRNAYGIMDKVQILDVQGRLLHTESCAGQEAKIDVSRLAAGSYVLKAINNNQIVGVKKIVKE